VELSVRGIKLETHPVPISRSAFILAATVVSVAGECVMEVPRDQGVSAHCSK